ncbi:MAG: glycosyltransferase family 1 protein [Deltaproteobacteria bacterium]|nr:glycosyltransferase family 1 protein [Deltaproteobacteria bacterium]
MTRYLIVTWDGAGNLVPTLGIARHLVDAGHDVRILGHDTIVKRCGEVGAKFIALAQPEGWDKLDNPDDFEAELELMMEQLCFSTAIAKEVASELGREAADVLMVDCMLWTALNVALASGLPTATLFHTPYTIFRGGPLVEMFAPGLVRLNAHRAELGLDPVANLGAVHDACDLALVALPMEFEPDAGDAPNVVRMGPVLDAPPLMKTTDAVDVSDGSTPLVLVSLSTSEQGQAELLQRIVDAVAVLPVRAVVTTGPSIDPATVRAGENTRVVAYVPHAELLPSTSLVITHAGLGTVMTALGNGVPLLCTPMGRDQFFNAEQVQALGAGRMLMPGADVSSITQAAREILNDAPCQAAAKQMAITISGYAGASGAVAALERLNLGRS